ncbi:hypothetical protein EXIGLDRAFT_835480 [Exidia glandulosa HHB12029]|uniref:LYR motif-containing protein Cup1-like N-terminal domain-containing protein n=1 Tax=Exidia glandulosa HHB12029 TaxID=1314781 RepID=A0A165IRL5_EXIGL|nr:hypothetical protein EXIGLDRAFT_835480 [Exidia glandulosa HHB12029]
MTGHPTVQLYRSLLCEARRLPHPHLRDYWRLRIQGVFRRNQYLRDEHILQRKVARAQKDLKFLRRANSGYDVLAFERVLDHAYGRRGTMKYELIKPLVDAPPLPPMVPRVPNSNPPASTPIFDAIVSSNAGRASRQKPIKSEALSWPPNLPVRDEEELKIFGPVPKRREVNARKKFFRIQKDYVYPPLDMEDNSPAPPASSEPSSHDAPPLATPLSDRDKMPFSGLGMQAEVLKLAGLGWVKQPWTSEAQEGQNEAERHVEKMPTRFLRRRYASLLRRLPDVSKRVDRKGKTVYDVGIPKGAIGADTIKPLPFASNAHISWWWGLNKGKEEANDVEDEDEYEDGDDDIEEDIDDWDSEEPGEELTTEAPPSG